MTLTPEDRRAHYAYIETGFRRRARNLRRIIEQLGGWEPAARATGRTVAKLHQIADLYHPWHQSIGDTLARELECALRLPPGALDSRESDPPFTPKAPHRGPSKGSGN